jgi:5-(carboxyamino)imidazole ribonucleotide synthase
MADAILPGRTVGILGGGQLGRMLALAARRMGYRVRVFASEADSPAGQVADQEVVASYGDAEAARRFAREVDVVTLEFENIAAEVLEAAESVAPVRPGVRPLYTAQSRLREKRFLQARGFPLAPFAEIDAATDLAAALQAVGVPAVLKTAGFGYDGKGQAKVASLAEARAAYAALGGEAAVLERFIALEREVSVVAARGLHGAFAHYGPIDNVHARHILDLSSAPSELPPGLQREAVELTREIGEALEMIGTYCVEFFVVGDRLLVNEIAPRPHNSGHLTLEASAVSQFEQQLRAVCGLPLGETEPMRPAAMANLLGELWQGGEPRWMEALKRPGVALHLYGKREARAGRKMGHLTAVAATPQGARAVVTEARAALKPQ